MKQLALVTGGNRGIGRGIVVALARRGFDLVFVDVAETEDSALTRQQAERDGARVAFVAADIADLAQHPRIVESAYAHGGRLDLLVNNAGVSVARRGDVLDVTPESFDRVMDINLRGTFFLSQAAARRMTADPPSPLPRGSHYERVGLATTIFRGVVSGSNFVPSSSFPNSTPNS